jgi:hypothetical protein
VNVQACLPRKQHSLDISSNAAVASLKDLGMDSQPTVLTDEVLEVVNALGGFGGLLARGWSSPDLAANAW